MFFIWTDVCSNLKAGLLPQWIIFRLFLSVCNICGIVAHSLGCGRMRHFTLPTLTDPVSTAARLYTWLPPSAPWGHLCADTAVHTYTGLMCQQENTSCSKMDLFQTSVSGRNNKTRHHRLPAVWPWTCHWPLWASVSPQCSLWGRPLSVVGSVQQRQAVGTSNWHCTN